MKYIDADKIRAEIERRFSEYNHDSSHHIQAAECASILDFLDTLEEPVSEDLEEELERRYEQAKWGYVDGFGETVMDKEQFTRIARHFAQWGAEHTPLPEDTVIFQKGVEEGKRLMMEGAAEGTVIELGETYKDLSLSVNAKELNQVLQPLGVGDGNKVKIIIVKEEEQ